jgi:3-dehydroquinate synthase
MQEFRFIVGGCESQFVVGRGCVSDIARLTIASAPRPAGSVVVVTDDRVDRLHANRIVESFQRAGVQPLKFVVPAGEASKTPAVAGQIYEFLMEQDVHRDGRIVAVGGGMVSDLAGFVAGTWMRGIDYSIFPTTVESAIDACLGGKTAVNLPGGKNLVGVFHPAGRILVDPDCFATLEPRDVRAGLAESIKHALISSEEFLAWHEAHHDCLTRPDDGLMEELIVRNLTFKGGIVSRDPFERIGERVKLNFGHTVGHAIEDSAGFLLRHGECVGLGMLVACRLSQRIGLEEAVLRRVEALLAGLGLPTRIPREAETERVLAALRRDKKALAGRVRFVLLSAVGTPVLRDDVEESSVRAVLEEFRG